MGIFNRTEEEKKYNEIIRKIRISYLDYECTKIIIAQKIISVKNADEIFVMKAGRIIDRGTHEELLKSSDFYKEIYDIQSGAKSIYGGQG